MQAVAGVTPRDSSSTSNEAIPVSDGDGESSTTTEEVKSAAVPAASMALPPAEQSECQTAEQQPNKGQSAQAKQVPPAGAKSPSDTSAAWTSTVDDALSEVAEAIADTTPVRPRKQCRRLRRRPAGAIRKLQQPPRQAPLPQSLPAAEASSTQPLTSVHDTNKDDDGDDDCATHWLCLPVGDVQEELTETTSVAASDGERPSATPAPPLLQQHQQQSLAQTTTTQPTRPSDCCAGDSTVNVNSHSNCSHNSGSTDSSSSGSGSGSTTSSSTSDCSNISIVNANQSNDHRAVVVHQDEENGGATAGNMAGDDVSVIDSSTTSSSSSSCSSNSSGADSRSNAYLCA